MPQHLLEPHGRHSATPLTERTPAHLVITPELLASTATSELGYARSFHRIWFGALAALCDRNLVTLFDTFVIGPPSPLVLEVAARLQRFHELDNDGAFFDENDEAEQEWWRLHEDELDDDDFVGHPPDPPTMVGRAFESMRHSQEFERLGTWRHIDGALLSTLDPGRSHVMEMLQLLPRVEALLADVAPFVRLNSGIVIDVRLDEDREPLRRRRLRRAA